VTEGLLLDTHAILWLVEGSYIRPEAILAIHAAQVAGLLNISPISAWEVGAALGKKNPNRRPHLQNMPADKWFRAAVRELRAKISPLTTRIAEEAAMVPAIYGYGDPGDCFLIATARVRNLVLATRDERIIELARRDPAYLNALEC
jgi:PIN domain nuclease of toxin-antitoxin system